MNEQIIHFLLSNNYAIAKGDGSPFNSFSEIGTFSILYRNPNVRARRWPFPYNGRRQWWMRIATFRFSGNGSDKPHWAFTEIDRKFIEQVKQLAQEMESSLNIAIAVRV
jgi:hypothetical protein